MRLEYFKEVEYIQASRHLREKVSHPVGKLYSSKDINSLIKELKSCRTSGYISSVGDRVTYTLVSNDLIPDLAVIDGKEKRKRVELVDMNKFNVIIYVENKPGFVNLAIIRVIRKYIKHAPILLYVEGEEDLVGFPVVLALDEGSYMVYGQPDAGIVLLKINASTKRIAANLLGVDFKGTEDYGE